MNINKKEHERPTMRFSCPAKAGHAAYTKPLASTNKKALLFRSIHLSPINSKSTSLQMRTALIQKFSVKVFQVETGSLEHEQTEHGRK